MTPEEQRIAIAEALGWTMFPAGKDSFGTHCEAHASRGHEGVLQSKLPDFPCDLNAMHEAWRTLDATQRARFAEELAFVVLACHNGPKTEFVFSRCSLSLFANCTPAERAEAFLKTINKWKE